MIEEQYVNFETAKLLKEKGFDKPCNNYYNDEGERYHWNWHSKNGYDFKNSEISPLRYSAPTQQMAMRWLREVHNIYIVVEPHSHNGFKAVEYEIMYWHEGHYHVPYQESHPTYHPLYGKTWNTYEEACEAAIRYCLEHLI